MLRRGAVAPWLSPGATTGPYRKERLIVLFCNFAFKNSLKGSILRVLLVKKGAINTKPL